MHTQPPPRPRATLHVEIERTVHLAVQQLGRPIVRSLRVENHGPGWIAAALVRVTVDPAVARDAALPLSPLAPGASQVVDVERLGMPLLVEPLLALAERAHGSVRVFLEGDCECEAVVRPLDVLPADHWPGQALPVDLLVAFVTLNAPGTATLLGHLRASGRWTGYTVGGRRCSTRWWPG